MLGASVVKEVESLEEVHPNLEVIHGYTDSYGKRKMAGFSDMGEEALWIIKEFIEEKDLTVAKLFAEFDEDGSNSVDYDEFRQGIKVECSVLSLQENKLKTITTITQGCSLYRYKSLDRFVHSCIERIHPRHQGSILDHC